MDAKEVLLGRAESLVDSNQINNKKSLFKKER
jgi:hypothetical protein